MGIVFVIAVFVLGILLFRMLNGQEKTYQFTQIATISYRPDGSEQVDNEELTGIIFIGRRHVTIDGNKYLHKSSDKRRAQARLNYDGKTLKTVSLFLANKTQRLYYLGGHSTFY